MVDSSRLAATAYHAYQTARDPHDQPVSQHKHHIEHKQNQRSSPLSVSSGSGSWAMAPGWGIKGGINTPLGLFIIKQAKHTKKTTGSAQEQWPSLRHEKSTHARPDRDGSLGDGRGPTTYTDVKLERFLSSEIKNNLSVNKIIHVGQFLGTKADQQSGGNEM